MELHPGNNIVRLVGTAAGRPTLSHESRGEAFYRLPLIVRRLSGAEDEIPLLLRRGQLESLELQEADKLCVSGELRSFNNRSGEGARLVITAFVRALQFCEEEDENSVLLRGAGYLRPDAGSQPPLRALGLPALHLLGAAGAGGVQLGSRGQSAAFRALPEPPVYQDDRGRAAGKGRL